ncbi:VirB3 family type IV secretion system protein [Sphingobium lactosutens]|uniref:Conjugal transfer protein TrbD n=1 Tax=Sphingobium lactosutens DS20 TaxID=1331060 RepID=T0J889_9SPHN|nr:VirB3 family type IV secretion system protein [Sphingobium lactosutens]EQB12472.1 conjugal transfer protein TrbD [Sphingobium lactosutens DS20]EQB18199.1 conjugal transfer protein TrbD [Sphingobium lactosutens DS20]
MAGPGSIADGGHSGSARIEGFEVPLHRSLTEAILLGGAPRGIAILNGTLAAAMGLGLQQWIAGLLLWLAGHSLAVFAAKRDPDFAPVLARHLRQKVYLSC